jgi:hypothetical protein
VMFTFGILGRRLATGSAVADLPTTEAQHANGCYRVQSHLDPVEAWFGELDPTYLVL